MSRNQISAIFDVPDIKNPIKLFDNEKTKILSLIRTLEVDGERVSEPSEYFTFDQIGLHTVSILLNSELESMSNLFLDCYYLTDLDLSNLNTSKVTSMSEMFKRCTSLTSIDFGKIDTSNVIDMEKMFLGCVNLLSLDLSNFNTSKVIDMNNMFSACSSLKKLDLSSFDT
jgi:surface protein